MGIEIGEVVFVGLPPGLMQAALTDGPGWRDLGARCFALSVGNCPVGKVQELGSDFGKDHSGKHLKDNMLLRFVTGVDPRIEVGSTMTVGDSGVNLFALVELGTYAHGIDPVNAQALKFTSGGQVVFAGHVNHPGTKANAFVEKSMREACQEALGASLI